ncbi:hypothetical protein CCP3SC15_470020 [Gammaproteobacteria bacterium]
MLEWTDAQGAGFDLIIMDWQMPGLNGLETIRAIRQEIELTEIPKIILITAYGREEAMDQAKDLGISAFLAKPTSQAALLEAVATVCGAMELPSPDILSMPVTETVQPSHLRGARILLVEDNPINQQIAIELLSDFGVSIDLAENGRKAVEWMQDRKGVYDAILMDIQMPEMDGLTATRLIRKQLGTQPLPIIAMTAHALDQERQRCREAGMDDHITKPIDSKVLVATLARWIKPREIAPVSPTVVPSVSSSAELLPETLPPFDIPVALQRVGGDQDLLHMLIIKFYESFSDTADKLDRLVEVESFDEACRLAHTLKGLAGTFGAESLAMASQVLEEALRNRQMEGLSEKIDAFKTELVPTLAAAATLTDSSTVMEPQIGQ